ncbi:MAG: transcriptional repressor [Deltaproteobacteria bacterium]|nr:transcriptional repressor [Deltaproteobacteria bacterium]
MKRSDVQAKKSKVLEQWFWKIYDEYVVKSQLKQSQQRRLVARYFLDLGLHVSADDLKHALKKDGHSIGTATIYRTLQLLSQANLAEEKFFQDSSSSIFELRSPFSHHDHLVCKGCGMVIEFKNEEIEKLQEKIALKNGFKLNSHRMELFGFCHSCNRSKTKS